MSSKIEEAEDKTESAEKNKIDKKFVIPMSLAIYGILIRFSPFESDISKIILGVIGAMIVWILCSNKKTRLIISMLVGAGMGFLDVAAPNTFRVVCMLILCGCITLFLFLTISIWSGSPLEVKIIFCGITTLFLMLFLDYTYIQNIFTRPINAISNFVFDKPILNETYYYDEGFLGMYKTTGKGLYIGRNGDVYEGNFVNEEFYGQGKLTFANGDVYEGEFVNGKRMGRGKFIRTNGEVLEGEWKDGEFIG